MDAMEALETLDLSKLVHVRWPFAKSCGRVSLLLLVLAISALLTFRRPISDAMSWQYNNSSRLFPYSCFAVEQGYVGMVREEVLEQGLVREKASLVVDDKSALLLQMWERKYSALLANPSTKQSEDGLAKGSSAAHVPLAPHLQDCEALDKYHREMDNRRPNGTRPVWPVWGGALGLAFDRTGDSGLWDAVDRGEELLGNKTATIMGPFPPWVVGADEDNLALTRRVQRDIWLHQHPRDCSRASGMRFLYVDWDPSRRLGTGSQLEFAAGALAAAMSNNLVLVLRNLDRADHDGCAGAHRGRLSCYFFPETSDECRKVADELAAEDENGASSAVKRIFRRADFPRGTWWWPPVPGLWGEPWKEMPPTTEVAGEIVVRTKLQDVRWWRAQALRYLLRFPSARTCRLLNVARHRAFGELAASTVVRTLPSDWPQAVAQVSEEGELERMVWNSRPPWVPRPLVSLHVRQGDKASEMKMASFTEYMALTERLRRWFPEIRHVWLSTEMQAVIEESAAYEGWDFHYTHVPRQRTGQSMHEYEKSVGRERSSDNAFVNLLMAADSDFFVGALGSTWCYVIDVMRMTGGKARQVYLSVNKDRFW